MKLFVYLRRALVGLRAGVGGPLSLAWVQVFQSLQCHCQHLCRFSSGVNRNGSTLVINHCGAMVIGRIDNGRAQLCDHPFKYIHLAILQGVSQKRNGLLVLAYAGGNA